MTLISLPHLIKRMDYGLLTVCTMMGWGMVFVASIFAGGLYISMTQDLPMTLTGNWINVGNITKVVQSFMAMM